MNALRPHRFWMVALGAALVLLALGHPILRAVHETLAQSQTALTAQNQNLAQNLRQRRDDAATAQQLGQTIDAREVETVLAPVNHTQILARFGPLAASMRLSAFTATPSPERPYKPEGSDIEKITQTTLTLDADAPQDEAVFTFLGKLQHALPGQTRLKHLVVERLAPDDAAAPTATNVHMHAVVEWTANQTEAGK